MATKVTMVCAALLVVFGLAMESAAIAFAYANSFNIINQIDRGMIAVDCGRTGWRILRHKGDNFEHDFTASVWRPTQYTCGFRWGSKVQSFIVWTDDDKKLMFVRHTPCEHCVWTVTQAGFSMTEFRNPATVLDFHNWL